MLQKIMKRIIPSNTLMLFFILLVIASCEHLQQQDSALLVRSDFIPIPLDSQYFDYDNFPTSTKRTPHYFSQFEHSNCHKPLVSIITTYFKSGSVVLETASSVANQTFACLEWILVNDASPESDDPALIHVKETYGKFDYFKYVALEQNRGLPGARNAGIDVARGSYLVFLDADDLLEPTFVEKAVWYLETHPHVTFVNFFSIAFEHERYMHTMTYQHDGHLVPTKNLFPVTCMIRTSVLHEIGLFNATLRYGLEDWDLWVRAASRGYWGHTIPEFQFWYRIHAPDARWKQDKVEFVRQLQEKYGNVYAHGVPKVNETSVNLAHTLPQRQLVSQEWVLFWIDRVDEREDAELWAGYAQYWHANKRRVTFVVQDGSTQFLPLLLAQTPDVFYLAHFAQNNQATFVQYLLQSLAYKQVITHGIACALLFQVNHSVWFTIDTSCPGTTRLDLFTQEGRELVQQFVDTNIYTPQGASGKHLLYWIQSPVLEDRKDAQFIAEVPTLVEQGYQVSIIVDVDHIMYQVQGLSALQALQQTYSTIRVLLPHRPVPGLDHHQRLHEIRKFLLQEATEIMTASTRVACPLICAQAIAMALRLRV